MAVLRKMMVLTLIVGLSVSALAQAKPATDSKETAKTEPAKTDSAEAPKAAAADQDTKTETSGYVLGPMDVVNVTTWHENEFTGQFVVRTDGKITLPLVADVQAGGLTPMQLGDQIALKLKKYLAEPRVTVTVVQMNSQRYYIMGEVGRGGAFSLLPGMTVMQAVASAGPTEDANTKKIYVTRKENGKETKFYFNYRDALKGEHPEQNITLKPGDTIVVP